MEDETSAAAVRVRYLRFAEVEGDLRSPLYAAWARGIAGDDTLLALLEPLTRLQQQPNLVLASLRFAGVPLEPWTAVRDLVVARWDAVLACILERSTQTNEARRLATLLPAFASLPQPLALIEVGASMGLCLQPTRWSYAYDVGGREQVVGDASAPTLRARLEGAAAAPAMPEVAWSAGLDLHPLSAASDDDVRWLETLLWPVGERGEIDRDRVERLHAAAAIAREHGPTVRQGDLVHDTWALVDEESAHAATTVVFHTAVLAYVSAEGRERFAEGMRACAAGGDVAWVSNEGLGVLPRVREELDAAGARPGAADFCIAIDERPFALADAHGGWVRVLGA